VDMVLCIRLQVVGEDFDTYTRVGAAYSWCDSTRYCSLTPDSESSASDFFSLGIKRQTEDLESSQQSHGEKDCGLALCGAFDDVPEVRLRLI